MARLMLLVVGWYGELWRVPAHVAMEAEHHALKVLSLELVVGEGLPHVQQEALGPRESCGIVLPRHLSLTPLYVGTGGQPLSSGPDTNAAERRPCQHGCQGLRRQGGGISSLG